MPELIDADAQALAGVKDRADAERLHAQLLARYLHPALTEQRRAETLTALELLEEQVPELAARRRAVEQEHDPAAAPTPRSPRRPAAPRKTAGRAGRTARGVGRQVLGEATGVAKPVSQMVVQVLGVSVAFAVIYALLRNADSSAPGRSAIELATRSFNTGLRVLVSPVDPLDPSGIQQARQTVTTAKPGSRKVGSAITAAGRRAAKTPSRPIRRTHTTTNGGF